MWHTNTYMSAFALLYSILSASSTCLISQTHEDLKRVILHQNASPGKRLGVRTWLKAIPQYNR